MYRLSLPSSLKWAFKFFPILSVSESAEIDILMYLILCSCVNIQLTFFKVASQIFK